MYKQKNHNEFIECAITIVSEIIAEGKGPFIEPECVNYLLAIAKDLCPDMQRNFQDSCSAQSCTRCRQELERLYLEADTFDC
jgi:hypothetical protein